MLWCIRAEHIPNAPCAAAGHYSRMLQQGVVAKPQHGASQSDVADRSMMLLDTAVGQLCHPTRMARIYNAAKPLHGTAVRPQHDPPRRYKALWLSLSMTTCSAGCAAAGHYSRTLQQGTAAKPL